MSKIEALLKKHQDLVDDDTLAAMILESMTDDEKDALIEDAKRGDIIERRRRWLREPVGIREFIESADYLNDKSTYPIVMDCLEELNSGKFIECVLTGSIGAAKTTMAVNTIAYQVYLLSCMRDPHAELGQNPRHEIVMIIQAITKESAKEVGYTRLRLAIAESPYFTRHFPFDGRLESQMKFPRNIRIKPVAGHDTAAIGQNVIGGILDEINFMKVIQKSTKSRDGQSFDQAKKNYQTIARRRMSRFMTKGFMPGMLCLVSSRNYPGQFTDEKELEAHSNPRIYVYDKRTWEISPDKFNPERFRLFVGDDTRRPRILRDNEALLPTDKNLEMLIPTDLKSEFEGKDIMGALRDIAGVATASIHPFILDKTKLSVAFGKTQSVLSRESADLVHTKLAIYPKRLKNKSHFRWVHIDPALTGDHLGLAMAHVPYFVNVKRGTDIETLPYIVFDFLLDVYAPSGGEIELDNIRRLIYALRQQGFPIEFVTMDTFQSRDNLALLQRADFNVGIQSVDEKTTPYDITKLAIYDERVEFPEHERALMELARIELDVKHKKIDHPKSGSKDVADAIAGCIYGLTMQRKTWRDHGVNLQAMPRSVADLLQAANAHKNSVDERQRRRQNDATPSATFSIR